MGAVLSLPYFRLGRRRATPAVLPPSPAHSQRTLVISHPRPLTAGAVTSPDVPLRPLSVRRAHTPSRRASARFKSPYDRDSRHPERQLSLRSTSRAGRADRRPRPRSYPPLLGDALPRLREEVGLGLHLFDIGHDDDDAADDKLRASSEESHETATVSTATSLSALEFLAGPALACTTGTALDPLPTTRKKKRRAVLTKHRTIEGGWDWVRAEDLSGWSSA